VKAKQGDIPVKMDKEELYDLEVTEYKIFRWGDYIFNFPCGKDNTIYETAMVIRGWKTLLDIPMLRLGMVLKDEAGQLWEIVNMEPFSLPPCKLKGASRFEPPGGTYSPYGWYYFRYLLEEVQQLL